MLNSVEVGTAEAYFISRLASAESYFSSRLAAADVGDVPGCLVVTNTLYVDSVLYYLMAACYSS